VAQTIERVSFFVAAASHLKILVRCAARSSRSLVVRRRRSARAPFLAERSPPQNVDSRHFGRESVGF